jgi:DNA-binding CsgD family transcriptional regulator
VLVAGFRLLGRLGSAGVEARVHPSGRIGDASAEASAAREVLRRAVTDLDRARGRLRRSAPEEALARWKGLVSARWSVVEEFDTLGRRYVLARRTEPTVVELALSPRERQAAGWARLGHSNKLIAYEMGISASTVGVLLHRAAIKLGVSATASGSRRQTSSTRARLSGSWGG